MLRPTPLKRANLPRTAGMPNRRDTDRQPHLATTGRSHLPGPARPSWNGVLLQRPFPRRQNGSVTLPLERFPIGQQVAAPPCNQVSRLLPFLDT